MEATVTPPVGRKEGRLMSPGPVEGVVSRVT